MPRPRSANSPGGGWSTTRASIIRPAKPAGDGRPEGCDIYISTSTAGGGLQMLVTGVVREMTAASAKRAALGAGAIVMDVIASNDKRRPHEQIQRIRELRPDMILMSGGHRRRDDHARRADRRADRPGQTAASVRQQLPHADDLRRQQGGRPAGRSRRSTIRSSCRSSTISGPCSSARTSVRPATRSTTCSSNMSWPRRRATTS